MVYIKPLSLVPVKSKNQSIKERFIKGEHICSIAEPNVRKYAYDLKHKEGLPVYTLKCGECNATHKHASYYLEWAEL